MLTGKGRQSSMNSPSKTPTTRLFVGSIPFRYTEGEMLSLFVPFGRIISLHITHTPWGKNRGFGYIEFDLLESAVQAKQQLHDTVVEGRRIIVDYALPDPYSTPEGKQRHQEALHRNPKKFRHELQPENSERRQARPAPKPFAYPQKRSSAHAPTDRQSVYDSRAHHSRVGAKFAKKNRR